MCLSKLTTENAFRLEWYIPKSFKFLLLSTDSVILDHAVGILSSLNCQNMTVLDSSEMIWHILAEHIGCFF
jgi:hypothetical protein